MVYNYLHSHYCRSEDDEVIVLHKNGAVTILQETLNTDSSLITRITVGEPQQQAENLAQNCEVVITESAVDLIKEVELLEKHDGSRAVCCSCILL